MTNQLLEFKEIIRSKQTPNQRKPITDSTKYLELLNVKTNNLKNLESQLTKLNLEKQDIEEQLTDNSLYESSNKELLKTLPLKQELEN